MEGAPVRGLHAATDAYTYTEGVGDSTFAGRYKTGVISEGGRGYWSSTSANMLLVPRGVGDQRRPTAMNFEDRI